MVPSASGSFPRRVAAETRELTLCVEQVIRDLELLPEFGGQNWSTVFLQKFEGSVTIWPKSRRAHSLSSSVVPRPD